MNKNKKPATLKGFRDILPEEMAIKQKVVSILVQVFESFGFQPLETPTLEYAGTLMGKYGKGADRLLYSFTDKGGRKVGLRYDLTVPICKVLSLYQNQIPLPFKRYQIQSTFRAEKPQRGRLREFTQCDIDTFGISSALADAEIILVIYTALKKLGFREFSVKINSRKVLFELLEKAKIDDKKTQLSVLQSIDKLDKKSVIQVKKELSQKGLSQKQIQKIFEATEKAKPDQELNEIFDFLKSAGVAKKYYQFSPSMVRGLDYYTRTIFETYVTKPKVGSLTGGGRYDNLVKQLGGPDITGTGTTIGLERIIEVIKEYNLWPNLKSLKTKVLVSIFSAGLKEKSIEIYNQLRSKKINTEIYLDPKARIDKQLKYADRKGIPYVIIIGPDEVEKEVVVLKKLADRSQKTLSLQKAIRILHPAGS